jgi:hypothetical protein
MAEPLEGIDPTHRDLAKRVQHSLIAADFAGAHDAVAELEQLTLGSEAQLYVLYSKLRLDAYQHQEHPVEERLAELELLRSRLAVLPSWPVHWYVLAWLTAPFVTKRPVDPFYLFHLAGGLQHVSQRQECLFRATYYGVTYGEHPFMARICAGHPYNGDWLVSAYYRAMIEALLAAYHRDGPTLAREVEGLRHAAGTPLEELEVDQLARRFQHFMA